MQCIHVEIAYATAVQQTLVCVELAIGSQVRDAVRRSGLLQRFPELKLADMSVGIFGQKTSLDTILAEGDRVEIYRPLRVDPKTRRRERAQS